MGDPPQSWWDSTPLRPNGQPKKTGMVGAVPRETTWAIVAHASQLLKPRGCCGVAACVKSIARGPRPRGFSEDDPRERMGAAGGTAVVAGDSLQARAVIVERRQKTA